jgi:precorrin-4/cobalt-precorrin-4 C11-methyltransferase
MELLKSADVLIYAGSLVSPELVAKSSAPVKMDSQHMSLAELTEAMVSGARQGRLVVRLHSGDPSLYGAIVEQIAELEKIGIAIEVVPGVSSMFAAAAALGTQLTLKGVSESVIVTRPAGATLDRDMIREFSRLGTTMVIFLGTGKIGEIVEKLECSPETPVAVVYHASWPDQKVVRGTVADIVDKVKAAGIEKTALIMVGGVVDPRNMYQRSVLYS